MSETKQSLEEFLFEEALRRPSADRTAFLDGVCQNDPLLRARLDLLLEGHGQADGFLTEVPTRETVPVAPPSRERSVDGQPVDRIDRYKLLEKIGEGGFGVVYIAEQKDPIKRRVALKIIKLGMDTKQVVARFEAERQALALMDHPNIAKVLDAGATDAGRPYFVMELVRGIPITKYCDQERLSTQDRLDLFIKVCHAIQHAHQKGIIHRDIKPSNILVTLHDGVPVPKVIDFGIAKATQGELTDKTIYTQFQQFIGTPAYMSPEQAEMSGLDVDTRTDVYSLGVLLYELLTGSTPFEAKELMQSGLDEMRRIIREREPVRPSTRLTQHRVAGKWEIRNSKSEIDRDLDWIVMKCLEKDRARRYETANGLAMDLKRRLSNEPVAARPPSRLYLLQKALRRNKVAFAAGGAIAGALVAGLSVSVWQAIKASRAQHAAEVARVAEREQRVAAQRERDNATASQKIAEQEGAAAQRNLYVANLNLIQQAWERSNAGRVRQLLEDTATHSQRGFEWYYWQRQTHLELKTLRGHQGPVLAVAFSANGQRLITASEDQTAKVWEAATGEELFALKGHSAAINSVAISADNQWIVTGGADQVAKVWANASGRETVTLKGHAAPIRSVAFSSDSQRIATGSADQTAKVWEAATGKQLLTLAGHGAAINSVAFSPDGQRIVTGSADKTARIWETASGKELRILEEHGAAINCVAFSSDGHQFATGSTDQTVQIWETASGKGLGTLKGHEAAINSVAFSLDGQRIVTGSADKTARIWETASGKELRTLKGHGAAINSVVFSFDGQRIVTGSADQTVKVWEAASDKEPLTLKGHRGRIFSAAFSPDGRRLITGSEDQTAKVWEAVGGRELLTLNGHNGWILRATFSPHGERIVTGSGDGTAKVWEAASGRDLLTLMGHTGGILSVAFSPNGERIVTGSADRTAKVWAAASGKELFTLKGHTSWVPCVAFSPDDRRIVTGSADQAAKVWNADNGEELFTLSGHSGWIGSVAFSPDGQRIVTGSGDQTAKVWDAASGRELLTLRGHSAVVNAVGFSPDGHRIVTGSYDQTAKVWEAAGGKELLTLKGHSDWIHSAAFSPDGTRIVTGSVDQTAKIWEAASVKQVASWHQEEQAAAEKVVAQQHERAAAAEHERALLLAQGAGAIKRWLILLPISYDRRNGALALQDEQVMQENQLRPRAGEQITAGQSGLVWRAVQMESHLINFNRLAGSPTPWSVAYAVSYILSETPRSDVLLKVGSDDQSKIYLNGRLIYQSTNPRNSLAEPDVVAGVELKAGMNVLVFKVVNETGEWQGSVRFIDRDGQPVPGLEVTIDPKGAEFP